ncbi:hypothetical protein PENTCL1PPCAC_21394 [Pristionchus entomophagus]|uniref:Nuclear receptor n=1 Tax=Pristionchus entomophagus TaxID=358040 RepID=A0AAV5TZ25_9BILA|nr:hypothetical protein PENTCL1PPCAC_21394 [Pristionchus entomophagus]
MDESHSNGAGSSSASNGKDRFHCLVCGAKSSSYHLGVAACRPCTVFYRRAKRRKMVVCLAISRRCAIDADNALACKRCRFDRFERLLKESRAEEMEDISHSPDVSSPATSVPSVRTSESSAGTSYFGSPPSLPSIDRMNSQTPSSIPSAFSPFPPNVKKKTRLLKQCKQSYRFLNSMRRTCELSARPYPPHVLDMNEKDCPIYPATYSALLAATKITMAAILEFADSMFPEFAELTREEKWNLTVSFYFRYQGFDSCYRAGKKFPEDLSKMFGSFTCFFDHDIIDGFFDDCTTMSQKTREEAKNCMHEFLTRLVRPARLAIARANLEDDEFHAIMVLLFWDTDGSPVRDEIVQIGERYKADVLQELAAYYREELGLNEYATRVGELFMLILHFEKNKDIKEHFEICRMLGIVNDDDFLYQLQKDSAS